VSGGDGSGSPSPGGEPGWRLWYGKRSSLGSEGRPGPGSRGKSAAWGRVPTQGPPQPPTTPGCRRKRERLALGGGVRAWGVGTAKLPPARPSLHGAPGSSGTAGSPSRSPSWPLPSSCDGARSLAGGWKPGSFLGYNSWRGAEGLSGLVSPPDVGPRHPHRWEVVTRSIPWPLPQFPLTTLPSRAAARCFPAAGNRARGVPASPLPAWERNSQGATGAPTGWQLRHPRARLLPGGSHHATGAAPRRRASPPGAHRPISRRGCWDPLPPPSRAAGASRGAADAGCSPALPWARVPASPFATGFSGGAEPGSPAPSIPAPEPEPCHRGSQAPSRPSGAAYLVPRAGAAIEGVRSLFAPRWQPQVEGLSPSRRGGAQVPVRTGEAPVAHRPRSLQPPAAKRGVSRGSGGQQRGQEEGAVAESRGVPVPVPGAGLAGGARALALHRREGQGVAVVRGAVEGQGGQHSPSPPRARALLAGLSPARLGLPVAGRELSSVLGEAQGVRWEGAAQPAAGELPARPRASLGAPPGTPLLRSRAQLAGLHVARESQLGSSSASGQDHPAALHPAGVPRSLLGSRPRRRGLRHRRVAGRAVLPLMWCSASSRAGWTLRAESGASVGRARRGLQWGGN